MAISFGSSSSKTNTNQQSQSEPWAPTMPYLTRFLQDIDLTRSLAGPSGDQLDAFTALKEAAAQGNQFAPQINQLANDTFNLQSRSGMADDAFAQLQQQLGDTASGKYLDFNNNPYIQQMLTQVGNDVQNRINQTFAGAGRNIDGNAAGLQAVARGVTQAQLPILSQLFDSERGRQLDAAGQLFTAGSGTAQLGQNLDMSALTARAGAVPLSNEAMNAKFFGPNQILNLDQQLKELSTDDLSNYANLLLPVAGLGGQQAGTSQSKSKSSGFGISLSDARVKEDAHRVGTLADGTPLYTYRYIGDDTPQIGVMAQDVERTNPDAVVETGVGDIKAVDYDAVFAKARRVLKKGRH